MGLYNKSELQTPEPVRKVKPNKKSKKKRKKHASQQGKIFLQKRLAVRLAVIAGIFCILLAAAGIGALINRSVKAAELTLAAWTDLGGDFSFNDGTKSSASGMSLYKDGNEYVAYVKTESDLKHVLSGLQWKYSETSASGETSSYTRNSKVYFKLATDMEYLFGYEIHWAEAERNSTKTAYEGKRGWIFSGDVFDGQGHTLTLTQQAVTGAPNLNMGNRDTTTNQSEIRNYGILFARAENATIKNFKIKRNSSNPFTYSHEKNSGITIVVGAGVVCGGATNTTFEDIVVETTAENRAMRMSFSSNSSDYSEGSFSQLGVGTIVGCMESDVTIRRCTSDIEIEADERSSNSGSYSWVSGGVIAGQAIGRNNTITACAALTGSEYGYSCNFSERNDPNQSVEIQGDILGLAGGPNNYSLEVSNSTNCVTIDSCIIHSCLYRTLGGVKNEKTGGACVTFNMENNKYLGEPMGGMLVPVYGPWLEVLCYGETEENGTVVKGIDASSYSGSYNDEEQIQASDIDSGTGNWFYDTQYGLHLLKDQYQLNSADGITQGDITFAPPNLLDPTGADYLIQVQGILTNWNLNDLTKSAKAEVYITTDGSDPSDETTPTVTLNGHAGTGSDAELLTGENDTKLCFSGTEMTVKARIKIVLNSLTSGTEDDIIFWSGLAERTYTEADKLLDKPVLSMRQETDKDYAEFEASRAYALGTTKMKLTVADGRSYDMFYYFGSKAGIQLGDTDTDSTLSADTLQKDKYISELTLSDSMLKNEDSNQIYLYVLVSATLNGEKRQKLYEYDIVTFEKDTLMYVNPENKSRIPSGLEVSILVGNGKANEFPYSAMRVLVSETQLTALPATLSGLTGVTTYDSKTGSGTEQDPWYLEARQKLTGNGGDRFYIYVEPIVNTANAPQGAIPYEQRYSSYVQEFNFTIMDKAASASLSPTTIKTTESGDATQIPVDEKIYMTAQGSNDLIVYNTTGNSINPVIVSDQNTLNKLNALKDGADGYGSRGEILYYEDSSAEKLYVKCNNIWYEMEDTDADTANSLDDSLMIYEDGKLYFDKSYEKKDALVSVIVFSEGYRYSDNDIYRYHVQEQGAVGVPIALLASDTTVSMNKVLNFSSDSGTVIYYTLDGREPEIEVDEDSSEITMLGNTMLYDKTNGISLTQENGFAYGETATIKMLACPVEDETQSNLIFNDKKKCSAVVTFIYPIAEQNQVEAPASYPITQPNSPTEVVNGAKISLTCGTSGADIYYTTNGTTPDVTKEEQKYSSVITVDGDYGSYYTVKAIAHKEGMKDSEISTFVYQIAPQEVVGGITATPGTSSSVIAGDQIILSAVTPDAQIFYTVDGSTPEVSMDVSGNSTEYIYEYPTLKYDPENPITVTEGNGYFIIHAIAVKADMENSPVAEFVYTYADAVGAPYGNPSPGTVTENTEVLLKSATKDAIIYYEISYEGEPEDPTQSSAVFSEKAPIVITRDTVVKAFAVYERESSEIVTLRYTLAEKMEKPGVNVSSGSIVPSGTKISFPVSEGTVYYTTDGSDPSDSKNELVNSGSSVVITGKAGDKITINACTKKTGATTSEVVTWTYQISQYPGGVSADTESGTVLSKGDMVHLITDVTGGTIYYTLGSGSPINSGTAGNSVTITGEAGAEVTLKAVAVAPNTEMTGSYASFQYKLMEQLAAPHASMKNGTVLTEATNLVLKANKGKIYYTIDGSTPDRTSYLYEYPIVIYKDTIVKAIAIAENYEDSEVSFFSFTFAPQVSGLKASKGSGTLDFGEVITLSADDGSAVIYYTTDGSEPDPNAEEGTFLYNSEEGIRISRNVSIKAIAVQDGKQNSDVLTLSYTVDTIPAQEEKLAEEAAQTQSGLEELNTDQLEERRASDDGKSDGETVIAKDINSGALVKGKEGVLPSVITMNSKVISISKEANREAKKLFGDEYEFLSNYEFALYENGRRIQPDGTVEIGIPIPEGYENADVVIVYNNEKGQITACKTRRENGYAYADVSHIKNFGIVGAKLDENGLQGWDLVLILTACAGVLVLIGLIMIIKTKRKRYIEES
ncbi:MAG: chitobiase/beta-hexosaminidase C-terminal domain-containing protein [Lachnospiraceae bacterium]|nr:chitobiase/beta-hexosaminidase C-terminal domain-containing protein [Lachnospiraceae bacterium]